MEVYVLVEKKKNVLFHILGALALATGVVLLFMALLGAPEFIPFAAIGIVVGWILKNGNIEYEYSYYDGEFRFARIVNKSRRKELRPYTIEELLVIAPIEDRAVYQYLNDSTSKKLDYTSNQPGAKVYALVAKGDSGVHVVKFEPDEKYLDAVCIKYAQKIKR